MSWIKVPILTVETNGIQTEDPALAAAMQNEPTTTQAWIDCDLMQHFFDCGNGQTKVCMQNGDELILPMEIGKFADLIGLI